MNPDPDCKYYEVCRHCDTCACRQENEPEHYPGEQDENE